MMSDVIKILLIITAVVAGNLLFWGALILLIYLSIVQVDLDGGRQYLTVGCGTS